MPYNLYLIKYYRVYINIEMCRTIYTIKFLFKAVTIVERAAILNTRLVEKVDIGSNIVVNRDIDAQI